MKEPDLVKIRNYYLSEIKKIVERHGLRKVCRIAGISNATICTILNGKRKTNIDRLNDYYNKIKSVCKINNIY